MWTVNAESKKKLPLLSILNVMYYVDYILYQLRENITKVMILNVFFTSNRTMYFSVIISH